MRIHEFTERKMTGAEKSKETKLKKKYDDGDMKKNMKKQYGKKRGEQVFYASLNKKRIKGVKKRGQNNTSVNTTR